MEYTNMSSQLETVSSLVITEPVLSTEPAYRGHALKSLNFKARSLTEGQVPVVVASINISDGPTKPPVPYRLPRISPQVTPRLTGNDDIPPDTSPSDSEKMWGRFGYEEVVRIPALMPSINKVSIGNGTSTVGVTSNCANNTSLNCLHPAFNPAVPRFKNAAITPRKLKDKDEFTIYKSMVEKAKLIDSLDRAPPGEPTPSPVTRTPSPTKSIKSIHWALGNNFKRELTFDRRGRGRAQGPFSREFTVTCYAPHNWLRLKLGRSKTTLD